MIESTAYNLVRDLAGDQHFRHVSCRSVPHVGRDRWRHALIVYGEVFMDGRWVAFSSRSAEEIYKLRRSLKVAVQ